MDHRLQLDQILLLLVITVCVTQANTSTNEYTALKPGQSITGRIGATYTTHIMECSRRLVELSESNGVFIALICSRGINFNPSCAGRD